MTEMSVITTLAGGLGAALALGYLAHRIGLSPIVGYLLAGIAIGPFTPGFVADRGLADQFAEVGVILMLFGIGLRFSLDELLAVWRVAVPGAIIQSALSTAMLAVLLHLFGWDWSSGIVLGLAISVSSTVVMARVLAERHDLHSQIGHIAIGWTVVEDLITVTILLLLPILITGTNGTGPGPGAALGIAGLKVSALVLIVVVLARWVIPWLLDRIEHTRLREFFTLAVLVLALGIAISSAKIFGVSMALGAFLAGLAVGRSEFASRAAGDALPMRDAFAVLFFVSIGMLFDPRSLIQQPLLLLAVILVVLVGKPVAAWMTVRLLGRPNSAAIPIGAALAQVGEFSFILGIVARQLGVIGDDAWNALVACSIISIALNPAIYRWGRRVSLAAPATHLDTSHDHPAVDPNHCILVGFGPVGRTLYRLLVNRSISVTVIELNLKTVRKLRLDGIKTIYGDVMRPGTLEEAGLAQAGVLVLSADVENAVDIVREARRNNPDIRILARCPHLRDAEALRKAGASVIAAGEAEVAVALAEAVISDQAIPPEDLARQRDGIRSELYSPVAPRERTQA
jgi:CPA2 family monovalent cation:H+ antiporter-2